MQIMWRKYEMVNHIKDRYSKLAQKEYKTRHDLVGKVIPKELCKRLKFDYTTKCYMHKPESVLENGTHKILWYFEILVDHLTLGLAFWPGGQNARPSVN